MSCSTARSWALPRIRTSRRTSRRLYGITVDILEARASEIRERIRVEHSAGRYAADVSENGRTTTTLQIKEDQVFDPHGPLPGLGHLKPEFPSDGMRFPVFAIVYGILANTNWSSRRTSPKAGST